MMLAKGFLHRMQISILCNAFDRSDVGALCLNREHGAAFDRATVEMNDTGTALTRITTDMCSGASEVIADHIDKQGSTFDLSANGFTVERE